MSGRGRPAGGGRRRPICADCACRVLRLWQPWTDTSTGALSCFSTHRWAHLLRRRPPSKALLCSASHPEPSPMSLRASPAPARRRPRCPRSCAPADPPALLTPPEPPARLAGSNTTGLQPPSLPARAHIPCGRCLEARPLGQPLPTTPPACRRLCQPGTCPSREVQGARAHSPCPVPVFSSPARVGAALAACERGPFVLDTVQSASSTGSAADERLWKGFFRLSKNSCLVTVRHLLLLARGTRARLRELSPAGRRGFAPRPTHDGPCGAGRPRISGTRREARTPSPSPCPISL